MLINPYIQRTIDRYKHELTCVQSGDVLRVSAPYMFGVTSYCIDSSGFSGLVISSNEKAEVLCGDVFEQMVPFGVNNPVLVRIDSFNLPAFNKAFSSEGLNPVAYNRLKEYYGDNYGEGSCVNNRYGYSFDFPSTYVAVVERGESKNINEAYIVELTGSGAGVPYAEITVYASQTSAINIEDYSESKTINKIQRGDGYLIVSNAVSRPHNDQSDELRAVSLRMSNIFWSKDGEISPLLITVHTIHSSKYDEVNFAYNYKYHEFLEDVIIETLKVNADTLGSN